MPTRRYLFSGGVVVYIVCTPSACKPVLTGLLVVDDFEFFAGAAAIVSAALVPLAVVSWTHQREIFFKFVISWHLYY